MGSPLPYSDSSAGRHTAVLLGLAALSSLLLLLLSANATAITLQSYSLPVDGVVDPEVSPDGEHVVLMGIANGYGSSHTNIFVYDLQTGQLHQMSNALTNCAHPTWSPDGTKIAFQAYGSGPNPTQEIWVVSTDGTGSPSAIIASDAHEQAPSWSPDGTRIVYMHEPPNHELWIKNLTSADPPSKLDVGHTSAFRPCWTEQGTIIFSLTNALWEIPDVGGMSVELLPASAVPTGGGSMLSAAIDREGERIVVPISPSMIASKPYELWLLRRSGGLELLVSSEDIGGGDALSPSWTPDGATLFFAGHEQLWSATGLPGGPVSTRQSTIGGLKAQFRSNGD